MQSIVFKYEGIVRQFIIDDKVILNYFLIIFCYYNFGFFLKFSIIFLK